MPYNTISQCEVKKKMVHTIAREDLTNITLRGRETLRSTYAWFHLYKTQKIQLMVMKIGIMVTYLAVGSGTTSVVLTILFLRQIATYY